MNKADLIQRIETDWARLQHSLDGLSEERTAHARRRGRVVD